MGLLAARTASSVFSALTAGMLVIAGAAARERRRLFGQKKTGSSPASHHT